MLKLLVAVIIRGNKVQLFSQSYLFALIRWHVELKELQYVCHISSGQLLPNHKYPEQIKEEWKKKEKKKKKKRLEHYTYNVSIQINWIALKRYTFGCRHFIKVPYLTSC